MPKLFDFINDLSYGKKNLLKGDPDNEKEINQYLINRAFSMGSDTVLYANELNKCEGLSNRMFHDYYFHSLRPRKRFNKWAKKAKLEFLEDVQERFQLSFRKAVEALRVLSMDQLEAIRAKLDKGGKR